MDCLYITITDNSTTSAAMIAPRGVVLGESFTTLSLGLSATNLGVVVGLGLGPVSENLGKRLRISLLLIT